MINKIWIEGFGDDYHDRNILTPDQVKGRVAFFALIFNTIAEGGKKAFPKSILEIGAGTGHNIKVLHKIIEDNSLNIKLGAAEPNEKARNELSKIEGVSIYDFSLPISDTLGLNYELVFTAGLLIHIKPDNLIAAMRNVYSMAGKYILCLEYFSPEERMIQYHGQENALWTRDYGSIWMDNFPLMCLGFGFLWKRITGFDNVTWFLFEKVN